MQKTSNDLYNQASWEIEMNNKTTAVKMFSLILMLSLSGIVVAKDDKTAHRIIDVKLQKTIIDHLDFTRPG